MDIFALFFILRNPLNVAYKFFSIMENVSAKEIIFTNPDNSSILKKIPINFAHEKNKIKNINPKNKDMNKLVEIIRFTSLKSSFNSDTYFIIADGTPKSANNNVMPYRVKAIRYKPRSPAPRYLPSIIVVGIAIITFIIDSIKVTLTSNKNFFCSSANKTPPLLK